MIRRVTNARTLGQRIRSAVIVGAVGLVCYTVYHDRGKLSSSLEAHHATKEIQHAIEDGQDGVAEKLLAEYQRSNALNPADLILFQSEIDAHRQKQQQSALIASFDAALMQYDLQAATTAVEHIRSGGPDAASLQSLEQRLTG